MESKMIPIGTRVEVVQDTDYAVIESATVKQGMNGWCYTLVDRDGKYHESVLKVAEDSAASSFRAGDSDPWPHWYYAKTIDALVCFLSSGDISGTMHSPLWKEPKNTDWAEAGITTECWARVSPEEAASIRAGWKSPSPAQAEEPRVYRSMDDSVRVYDGERSYGFRPNGTAYPEDHIVLTERGCQLGNHEVLTGPERDEFVRAAKAGEDARWPRITPDAHIAAGSDDGLKRAVESEQLKRVTLRGAQQVSNGVFEPHTYEGVYGSSPAPSPQAELPSAESVAHSVVGSDRTGLTFRLLPTLDEWTSIQRDPRLIADVVRRAVVAIIRLRDQQHGERGGVL